MGSGAPSHRIASHRIASQRGDGVAHTSYEPTRCDFSRLAAELFSPTDGAFIQFYATARPDPARSVGPLALRMHKSARCALLVLAAPSPAQPSRVLLRFPSLHPNPLLASASASRSPCSALQNCLFLAPPFQCLPTCPRSHAATTIRNAIPPRLDQYLKLRRIFPYQNNKFIL